MDALMEAEELIEAEVEDDTDELTEAETEADELGEAETDELTALAAWMATVNAAHCCDAVRVNAAVPVALDLLWAT